MSLANPNIQVILILLFLFPRDELKRHYNLGHYYLDVSLDDLASFDEDLADQLQKQPAEYLPLVRQTKEV